jgi:hypothetical protein
MSDLLKAFYIAYLAWIDAGATQSKTFSRGVGLCSNFDEYMLRAGLDFPKIGEEQRAMYVDHFNYSCYPFHESSFQYADECWSDTCHLNPKRIQWVRDQVAKIKEETK